MLSIVCEVKLSMKERSEEEKQKEQLFCLSCVNTRLIWPGVIFGGFGFLILKTVFICRSFLDGTTACEKRLLQFIFVFEYLIYSSTFVHLI